MAANQNNLVMGPATLYVGAFEAAEPADADINTNPASSAWTDMGATMDGAEISIEQDYKELEADQFVDVPGARLTKRTVKVKVNLAEPTLENLLVALNDGTVASGSGYESYEPEYASSATQPTYRALIIDGYAPGAADLRRRVILRKVLSTDNVKFEYKKDGQTVFSVEFQAFYVDSETAPYKVIDEVSA
jgi:hypothetical protein